jgi:hypothetical protein
LCVVCCVLCVVCCVLCVVCCVLCVVCCVRCAVSGVGVFGNVARCSGFSALLFVDCCYCFLLLLSVVWALFVFLFGGSQPCGSQCVGHSVLFCRRGPRLPFCSVSDGYPVSQVMALQAGYLGNASAGVFDTLVKARAWRWIAASRAHAFDRARPRAAPLMHAPCETLVISWGVVRARARRSCGNCSVLCTRDPQAFSGGMSVWCGRGRGCGCGCAPRSCW